MVYSLTSLTYGNIEDSACDTTRPRSRCHMQGAWSSLPNLKRGRRKVLFHACAPCGWSECAHIQSVPSLTGIHGMRELRGGRNPRPFSPSLNRKQLPFVNTSRIRHYTRRPTHSAKQAFSLPQTEGMGSGSRNILLGPYMGGCV